SPRSAAPGPTYTSRPIVTWPVTVAFGWTKAVGCTTGTTPSNANIPGIPNYSPFIPGGGAAAGRASGGSLGGRLGFAGLPRIQRNPMDVLEQLQQALSDPYAV